MGLERILKEVLEYIFQPGDMVRSLPTGKIYTVEETVHEGMKVYLLPRQQSDERLYIFACQLLLVQTKDTDIRKPEPEKPLIVKSGGSLEKPGYVAFWKGVDYLYVGETSTEQPLFKNLENDIIKTWIWKSFSGLNPDITELTDEIAKLRPMILYKASSFTYKLWGVNENHCILSDSNYSISWRFIDKCRLATAEELKEIDECG